MSTCSSNGAEYNIRDHVYLCGYANVIFTVIGTFFNLSVMMVYTRNHMTSPMHTIIANLAATDVLTTATYLPHSWQELRQHRTECCDRIFFYSWHLAAIFNHASTWLAISLGVWRYIGIIHPLKERNWCNTRTTRIIIIACYILGTAVSVPNFLLTTIDKVSVCYRGENTTIHQIRIQVSDHNFPSRATFIFYCAFLKTFPSVVLTTISCRIITALRRAKLRHEQLTRNTSTLSNETNRRYYRKRRQTVQITKMLLIVLTLFMIAELPQGIFCLLTVIYGSDFYYTNYYCLSEIFNTVNNFCDCAYFLVYYVMSNKFRDTLKVILKFKAPYPRLYQNTLASCNANSINQCNNQIIHSFP